MKYYIKIYIYFSTAVINDDLCFFLQIHKLCFFAIYFVLSCVILSISEYTYRKKMTTMDISLKISQQRNYFFSGKTKSVGTRLDHLKKLKESLKRNESAILRALKLDLGKSNSEAYMSEIGLVLEEIKLAIEKLKTWAKPQSIPSGIGQLPGKTYSVPEPYGLVLIISPWNYPFLLTMDPLIGAIAAGNCCLVKPSSQSSCTSAIISTILGEVFEPDYVSVVGGSRSQAANLLDEKFDYIFFTGSATTGKEVMGKAALNLTPVTLELGGKSPCIVDETANLTLAARRIVFGKLLNSGQTCVAPDYILVQDSVKEEFLTALKKEFIKQIGDNPLDNPDYGHIINQKQFTRLLSLLQSGTVFYGGKSTESALKIEPTILTDVSVDSPIMQQEIFGPILPVLSFHYLQQAEHFISQRPKPLAVYLFSENHSTMRHVSTNLSFGGGCINDTVVQMASPHAAFGGVGESGMGKYHGKYSFDTFSHQKTILIQSTKVDLAVRYQPYRHWKKKIVRKLFR